ncbi:hypothetical protein [Variovorax saccharolyticus]|uniref:hypothetical protein n=1 Tax=Variovorax saccharolyticus TaxID=3053516 RepID=UPI00257576C9|nr:hypothetical protein [Variovorax sp. J22R187]MDM0021026.1 hypothetical protein [Variovorax sp. J22R187]
MRTSTAASAYAAVSLAILCFDSAAQAPAPPIRSTCQNVGVAAPEPLGDREGHFLSVGPYSCVSQGGVLDGTVSSGMNIWDVDKGAGVLVTGNGVMRKPGMMVVFTVTEGSYALTMADGKVTGFAGSAKGVYKLATGSAASLSGKAYTARFRSIDRGQFVIETTVD